MDTDNKQSRATLIELLITNTAKIKILYENNTKLLRTKYRNHRKSSEYRNVAAIGVAVDKDCNDDDDDDDEATANDVGVMGSITCADVDVDVEADECGT